MSNSSTFELIQTDWEYEDSDTEKKQENGSESTENGAANTDICGVYEIVIVRDNPMSPGRSQAPADENGEESQLSGKELRLGGEESQPGGEESQLAGGKSQLVDEESQLVGEESQRTGEESQLGSEETSSKCAEAVEECNVPDENCSSVESGEKDLCKSSKCKPGRKKKRKILRKRPSKVVDENAQGTVPSVYSCAQIKRHKKRLKMKAMAESSDTDSEATIDENSVDPDLDINLRIFEESTKSIENVVIGEIHCDVLKDTCNTEERMEPNKNANVFKLSVNANFSEDKDQNSIVDDDIGDLEGLSDDYLFSDNDSDLEILTSKPIVRKRAVPVVKKERTSESDKKKTMYDLIHDAVSASPKDKDESGEIEKKKDLKNNDSKKNKTGFEKRNEQNMEEEKRTEPVQKERNEPLPVPQLKVNAEGEVILDMDSLVIEQTGIAEAREALENSEIVEETGLSYSTYTRKCNYRKQWSPRDTLKFYDVLSAIGTDFSLMATLFPGRTRNCMKRKFKREEKANSDLILKALTCRQRFNIELLEKELKLKEQRVNLLKKTKKEKMKKEKPKEKAKKKETTFKRRSFFERGISCFQMAEEHL